MKKMTLSEFRAELANQFVAREDIAFTCPICHTVQSMRSLIKAGAGKDAEAVSGYIGYSCIGRFTGAGPHQTGAEPGKGCDWTLGGLLHLHELEVTDDEGARHFHFMPATAEQAQALAAAMDTMPWAPAEEIGL